MLELCIWFVDLPDMAQLNATKKLVFFFDANVKVMEKELCKHFLRLCNWVNLIQRSMLSEFMNTESCGSKIGVPLSYT